MRCRTAGTEHKEVGSVLELTQILSPAALPSSKATLTLSNSRISKTSLCDGAVFTVFHQLETLNQTNDFCYEYLHVKLFGKYTYTYTHIHILCNTLQFAVALQQTIQRNVVFSVERGRIGYGTAMTGVRKGCSGQGTWHCEVRQAGNV